jgi:hypothetical protein
VDCVEGNA